MLDFPQEIVILGRTLPSLPIFLSLGFAVGLLSGLLGIGGGWLITPSLNASVATALCLYEVARRGWMKGLKGQNPSPRIVRPQLSTPPPETPEHVDASLNGTSAGDDAATSPADASVTAGMKASSESERSQPQPEDPGIDLGIERLPHTAEPRFEGSIDL